MDIPEPVEQASNPHSVVNQRTAEVSVLDSTAKAVLKLLIIDQEVPNEDTLCTLRREAIVTTCAQSGALGLTRARLERVDAILLDLKLPDIAGMTVMGVVRVERPSVPVIVCTGVHSTRDDAEQATRAGAVAFVPKPITDALKLATTVRRAVTECEPTGHAARCLSRGQAASEGFGLPSKACGLGDLDTTIVSELHARALRGETDAVEEVARVLLPVLCTRLRRLFPLGADDWVDAAAADALVEYSADPSRYNPSRGLSLRRYLEFNATRNVLNARDSARRRLTHETTAVPPELWQSLAAPTVEEPSGRLEQLRSMLATVRAALTSDEQIVHDLQMADEHDTAVYARELHLEHLPWAEQVQRVRRLNDAVAHKVRRAIRSLYRNGLCPPKG